jgi:hypothetical protein
VTLLFAPSLFHYAWHFSIEDHPLFAYFAWGISNSSYPLIGVWLASRDRLFDSLAGWCRVAIYLLAAIYGCATGSVLQDWLLSDARSMPIPGSRPEHFGLAVLFTLEVAVVAWLFWLATFLVRRLLTDRRLHAHDVRRPNVRFLLLWIASAAVILTSVRLLATYGKPLNLSIANLSVASAMTHVIARVPVQIVHLIAITIIMIGFAGSIRHCAIAAISAPIAQFLGEQMVFWATSLVSDPRSFYGVMAGPLPERLPYFAGSIVAAIAIIWFARMTGLVFARAVEPAPAAPTT